MPNKRETTNRQHKRTKSTAVKLEECKNALAWAEMRASLLDLVPTPVMSVDRDFNVTYMNSVGASILGKTPEACIGLKCFDLFNTTHCNTPDCQLAKAMQLDGVFTDDTVAKLPNGDLPIRYTGVPVKDVDGNVIGALEYVLDIRKEIDLTKDIIDLVDAVKEGKLESRADMHKYQGNYRRIIENVNTLMEAFIAPINVTVDYIADISKGEIPQKITDEYKGDFNKIKGSLNTLIDTLEGLTAEAAKMEKAATNGDLDIRADVSKYQGAFASIIKGLNDTAEAIVIPLRDVGTVLDKLAGGDFKARVVNDYKGDYEEIGRAHV